jgi:hypothetical protein
MLYSFGIYASPAPPFSPAPGIASFIGGGTNASTTQIKISGEDFYGNFIPFWLTNLSASTNPIKGSLRITVNGDTNKFVDFQITGNVNVVIPGPSGDYEIPVTFVADSGYVFNFLDNIVISFARAGDLGATGSQGATGSSGSVPSFVIDYQIIPDPTQLSIVPVTVGIYYSSAMNLPSCNQRGGTTLICTKNRYDILLYQCQDSPGQCGTATVYLHQANPSSTLTDVCQSYTYPPTTNLQFCPNRKYFCAIIGPTSLDPNTLIIEQPGCFIEWFWAIGYNPTGPPLYVTGKFTFMATYDYILNYYNTPPVGWIKPVGSLGQFGCPLFNPSNHNP